MWDPQPPSKQAPPPLPPPHPSATRLAHVTAAAPAKRITFYKSGDSRFRGVRMTVHRRSFKCFDALMDDLSQKVPLPFGVRTVTTPRGTHTIRHLEQLQDGGCYLCSDRRPAKPINMELASKRPSMWYYHSRGRPDGPSATPPGRSAHRQPRILLLKNGDPGVRRSLALSRRCSRSIRALLEEASQLMHFHVRKLYTLEGRKVDSVQSLTPCPGVLVCVGREPFSPVLVHFIRKSSEEKLPGLNRKSPALGPRTPGNGARSPGTQGTRSPPHGAQSRASEYSDESKRNVNFGLETKKSIIHPRADSSHRSARPSLSSEKSYANGVSAASQSRPTIMNDDIEKRVLVNTDGSLSLEMRVRFHLQSDETLQWSTQVQRSPPLTNHCGPLSQDHPHYLQQGQSESCSDPESASFDQEGRGFSGRPLPGALEGAHCPCCHQSQEQQYDLWKNPAHRRKQPAPPLHTSTTSRHSRSSSSSSSCNSRRVVHRRVKLSDCGGIPGAEQVEMCVMEKVEHRVEQDGDNRFELRKVSRCCSRSEVITVDNGEVVEEEEEEEEEVEGRPMSAVSSSSRVLQALKEDQDEEEVEDHLPPSASQCCQRNELSPAPTSHSHMNDKPASSVWAGSAHSTERNTQESKSGSRAEPVSPGGADEMVCGVQSNARRASKRSTKADDASEDIQSAVSGSSGRSEVSGPTSVCPKCGGCKRGVSFDSSRASQRSRPSTRLSPKPVFPLPNQENPKEGSDDGGLDVLAQSNKSNITNHGHVSAISNALKSGASGARSSTEPMEKEEARAPSASSATSHRSNRSHNSCSKGITCVDNRSHSAMFAESNQSTKTRKSHCSATADTPDAEKREDADGENVSDREISSMSAKSGSSVKSHKSNSIVINHRHTSVISSGMEGGDSTTRSSSLEKEEERALTNVSSTSPRSSRSQQCDSKGVTCVATENVDDRSHSAMSAESKLSSKSRKSYCSTTTDTKKWEEADGEGVLERAVSSMSAKSGASVKSPRSKLNVPVTSEGAGVEENETPSLISESSAKEQRPATTPSAKSETSTLSSSSNCARASPGIVVGEDERPGAENRTASAMSVKSNTSAKSNKSLKSNKAEGRTLSPRPDTKAGTEDRAESQMSAKSVKSVTSSKSNCNGNTGASSEVVDHSDQAHIRTGSTLSVQSNQTRKSSQVASPVECKRTSSALSGKSRTSAKSSKSHKTNDSPTGTPNSTQTDGASLEVNGNEKDNTEQATSATSVTSKSPMKWTNVTTETVEDGKERPPSAVSDKPHISSAYNPEGTTDGGEDVLEDNVPKSRTSTQTLSPRRVHSPKSSAPPSSPQSQQLVSRTGETRGSSTSSFHSTTSAKSGRSNCCCGAGSGLDQEQAVNTHSTWSKQRRTESGDTEHPQSPNSSASVSLGLTADPETESDSESHANGDENKSKTLTPNINENTGEISSEERQRTASAMSQTSNNNGSKSPLSQNPSALDIPTIETPGGPEDEDVEEHTTHRAPSEVSKSHKSVCKCDVNTTVTIEQADSTTSIRKGSVRPVYTSASSANTHIRSKSPRNNQTPSGESGNSQCENQASSTRSNDAKQGVDLTEASKSPCGLKTSSTSASGTRTSKHDSSDGGSVRSVKTSTSQKNQVPVNPSSPCPMHISRPDSKVDTASESILSHSLSAADLLKDKIAGRRPNSQQSKSSKTSGKSRSERSGNSQRSKKEKVQLMPSCLPNASPSEVVSDWLRSIPANSSMLALGDELNEGDKNPAEGVGKEKEEPEDNKEDEAEEDEEEKAVEEEEERSEAPPADATQTSVQANREETVPRSWNSSATVMKVLLGSSMGRCRSMPEVSALYGLSVSARGLLDCLSQLQLIGPALSSSGDAHKNQQYTDIMAVLQSLWLSQPQDPLPPDVCTHQVSPPRSSSGVGMSSGSGGSGKYHENQGAGRTPLKQASPEGQENILETDSQRSVPPSFDSPKATENPSSCDKSSANDSSKSASDNETLENSGSATPPTVPRALQTKRATYDPDPVWVTHLLQKLEKQFMNHYTSAVAEFKVRWDLDDSVILNAMTSDLRDEVNRRIQTSIQNELKKIQSRVGKPRPPQGVNLSRESTMTEKRRRLLKVMKNQSVKTGASDEDVSVFSDQRSQDDFCPCDACVRRKMVARPLKKADDPPPLAMEFDLLKILQHKKTTPPQEEEEGESTTMKEEEQEEEEEEEEEVRSLGVVHEEEEEEEDEEGGAGECQCQGEEDRDKADQEVEGEQEEEQGEKQEVEQEEEQEEEQGEKQGEKQEEEQGEKQEEKQGEKQEEEQMEQEEEEQEEEEQEEEEQEEEEEEDAATAALNVSASAEDDDITESQEGEGPVEKNASAQVSVDQSGREGGVDRQKGGLLPQVTRTSVESQPGSLDAAHAIEETTPTHIHAHA